MRMKRMSVLLTPLVGGSKGKNVHARNVNPFAFKYSGGKQK